jgi:ubiquinol-cytochrome c reductase cytochrome b subunit
VAWSVLLPALLPLGLIMTGAALWPFLEQWVTGDRSDHNINDRPRNAPTRTAIGMAAIAFYGVLWLEGANDVIADHLSISLYVTTEISRYAIFIAPVVAYWVTKRICLGLQRKDMHLLEHGVETGIIRQLPSGEFIEETRPLNEEERAVVEARQPVPSLPAGPGADSGVPPPAMRGGLGRVRQGMYNVLSESVPMDAHGNGHGDGHGEPDHAAVPAGTEPGDAAIEDRGDGQA